MAWTAPSHYLNQCWNIVNWTLRNKLQWNFNRTSYIFIQENALVNVVCEMASILSRPQCVNMVAEKKAAGFTSKHMSTSSRGWFCLDFYLINHPSIITATVNNAYQTFRCCIVLRKQEIIFEFYIIIPYLSFCQEIYRYQSKITT